MRRMTAARFTLRLIAFALVGVAMAVSALALLYWGRDQTIRGDELGYAARLASQPFGEAVLEPPPNKYFIALPLLLYHALFHAFGLARGLQAERLRSLRRRVRGCRRPVRIRDPAGRGARGRPCAGSPGG